MPSSSDLELRRQLEEPLNQVCRNYPIPEAGMLVTMLDVPYYPPFMEDAPHVHNCMEIGFCVSGSGSVRLCEKLYPFSAGSIVVAPKGVYHSQEYASEQMIYWRYLVINDDYLLRHLPERYRHLITTFFDSIRESGLFLDSSPLSGTDSVIQLMFDLRRQGGGVESSAELELCLLLLLQLIARHAESTPLTTAGEIIDAQQRQPIEAALAYVYEHYKEDIPISELARSCSMSESYFRKQFLKIMGQSPLEYVNAYRIHRSMNLLRTTSDSIQSIAVRSGFSSIAAFNRNFRQLCGVSPSQWRRAKKER